MPVRKTGDLKVQLQITIKQASVRKTHVYRVSDRALYVFTDIRQMIVCEIPYVACICCELVAVNK